MSKSRDAFRTISEVSDALDTPAHVLRFWESKFSQVKPVKRAGGRRYYRPGDLDLLAGIKKLLHDDGMTIKGAQKLLREQGVKHISGLGAAILADQTTSAKPVEVVEEVAAPVEAVEAAPEPAPAPAEEADTSNVVTMATAETAAPADEGEAESPTQTFPADPSDSDSKAPARIFHLLRKTPAHRVAAHADAIAPLLARMQTLRDRVAAR